MRGLTEKQKGILEFVETFQESTGMAPTVYEIAEAFRIKTSTVFAHLRALQKKDCLTRSSKARSIMLTKPSRKKRRPSGLRAIPIVSAADSNWKKGGKELFCDVSMLGRTPQISDMRNLYAIRIQGGGLKSRGILNGDMAIIRREPVAVRTGDVVLAMINGTPELRNCARVTSESIEIASDDPTKQHTVFPLEEAPLKGIVVGVQRAF